MFTLRPTTPEDLPLLHAYLCRLIDNPGAIPFTVHEPGNGWHEPLDSFITQHAQALLTPVASPGWERSWVLTNGHTLSGEIRLAHRPVLHANRHRCLLMMGMETSMRGRGYGKLMVQTALDWARAQPELDWVDLYHFASNTPASTLYAKFGFKEVGRVPDTYRIQGTSFEDVMLTLKVKK